MQICVTIFASFMCLVHADFAAPVEAEASSTTLQPHINSGVPLKVHSNDTLFVVQNDAQTSSLQNNLQTNAAALTSKSYNAVVHEIRRHDDKATATVATDAMVASPTPAGTVKPKARNGVVRVSTVAPSSAAMAPQGSENAEAPSHLGMFREGGALTCLAVLVLWLTRKSLWAMWEEVRDPNGDRSGKFEESLEPGAKAARKARSLTAHDFGTPNEDAKHLSQSFAQNTDCFQRRLDQVLQTHRVPVGSSSPVLGCSSEPTL